MYASHRLEASPPEAIFEDPVDRPALAVTAGVFVPAIQPTPAAQRPAAPPVSLPMMKAPSVRASYAVDFEPTAIEPPPVADAAVAAEHALRSGTAVHVQSSLPDEDE